MKRVLLVLVLGIATSASAQDGRGPTTVIQQARENRQAREMEATTRGAEDTAGAADPHDPATQAALRRALGESVALAEAKPSDEVPSGTIEVWITDESGRPAAGAEVILGIVDADNQRKRTTARTDQGGIARFADLKTGGNQAYRVSTVHEGATYGATPFRLPLERGYQVRLVRLPTTRDERSILMLLGRTIVEFKNERMRVLQQAQLTNLGERTYVFPEGGLQVRLPEGAVGFQSQEVMSDQRFEATDGGFKLSGSIPPGRVTLAWAFDVPISGTEATIEAPVPFRSYVYQVMAEAASGMELEVNGFPPAVLRESDVKRVLLTQVERTPESPPLTSITLSLRGIPGPGPYRWFALFASLAFAALGIVLAVRNERAARNPVAALEARKAELLAEAAELERLHAASEIGPQYKARRTSEVVSELAALLRQEATLSGSGGNQPRSASDKART